jgi:O-antigen ligase
VTFLDRESPLKLSQNSSDSVRGTLRPVVRPIPFESRNLLVRHPEATGSRQTEGFGGAYFWLVLFFLVYCGRPEDWIPGLSFIPLAKIAGVFALLAFGWSVGGTRRNLPREIIYLILLFVQLWLGVPLSPVWRGGAFYRTLDFSKVLVIMLVMTVAVTTLSRLRRLIFVQTACVSTIAVVTLIKGHFYLGRLEGVLSGDYANPNDLALVLVLTLPFCLAFLMRTTSFWRKAIWIVAGLVIVYVVLLTGSRAGLLGLLVNGGICLWEFGIKQRRPLFLFLTGGVGLAIILLAGNTVKDRFNAMWLDAPPNTVAERMAYGSAMNRRELFSKSLAITADHPLFGIGVGNFVSISGNWHDQHNSYTQMSSEGGLPAMILYLLILWRAFRNLRDTKKIASVRSEEALFATALVASLGGFLVGSWFASVAYQFFPYLLVGYTSTLVALVKKNSIQLDQTH